MIKMPDNDKIMIQEGFYVMSRGIAYYHIKMDSDGNPFFSTDGKNYAPLTPRYARGLRRLDNPGELVKLVQEVEAEKGPRAKLGRAPPVTRGLLGVGKIKI